MGWPHGQRRRFSGDALIGHDFTACSVPSGRVSVVFVRQSRLLPMTGFGFVA
jgi:hypothetical protein